MNPLSFFYSIRSYVEAYAGLIGRRFITVIWVIALCVVIWFYGYLLAFGQYKPLATVNARLMLMAAVVVIWLGYLVFSILRSRKREDALVDGLEQSAEAQAAASQKAEVGEIHARLKEALQLLRRVSRKRFGYMYELPWYVIFGAPGSGKTTALTNSGLSFPLGDALGSQAVQGIGGTRNCNWWFTDDAILIDTAGRYTTQDDLNGAAKAGWEGFLGLLRKYRRSQPINGALITLSIGDLLDRDPETRREEVRIIRQRLAELDRLLQVRVPVYLVLTKADLLTGFVEFFDGFNKSDREQVWGMTFSLEDSEKAASLTERFGEEFTLLQERVGSLLLERLQQEPNSEIRGRIFRFPAELANLRESLADIVSELCAGSKLMEPPLVRGLYFASGTQVAASPSEINAPRPRRSYFLTRLFNEVIFEEASLVVRDKRLTRRQLMVRRATYSLASILVLFVLASWIATYLQNAKALASAEQRLNAYEQQVRDIPVQKVNDTDFLRILPALDNLAAISSDFEDTRQWPVSFGLDQQDKVEGRQRDAYQRALNALLLPRIMVQLQRQMESGQDPRRTFDAMKLYGMLGGLGSIDPEFVGQQAEDMYSALLPGDARATARASLVAHTVAMTRGVIPPIELDNRLIAEAQTRIRDIGVAVRAFEILKGMPAARELAAWTPSSALGPLGEQAFQRVSGTSLREGLPGIFTARGYRDAVLPGLDEAAREAIAEEWVRGIPNPADATVDRISQSALQLYVTDFERRWQAMLADIRVKPSQTVAEAAETLRILSADPNPIEAFVRSVTTATDLRAPATDTTASIGGTTQAVAATTVATTAPPDPFGPLRDVLKPATTSDQTAATASNGAAAEPATPMKQLVASLQKLRDQLTRASTSTAAVAKVFDVDGQLTTANQDLLLQARQMPVPLDTMMAGVAADIGSLAVRTARARINEAWTSEAAQYCNSVVANRYPFDREAQTDVAMSDFVRLFAPDGIMSTFFKEKLEPFVDTNSSPWGWKGTFGTPGMASEAVADFEKADQITRAFFPNGAKQVQVAINITPASLSQSANAVMLELAGEKVVYFHGPVLSKSITWPPAQASNSSRLAFQPGGWQQAMTTTGDWSPFRLFDNAKVTPGDKGDLFRATFDRGDQTASFDVQFGSVLNPFRLQALEQFSCPKQF